MIKKFFGIIVCLLLITTGVVTIADSEINTSSRIAEKSDCGCCAAKLDNTCNLRIFPPPVMTEISQLSAREVDTSSIPLIDTPEYFNWMDHEGQDWTTPVKEQKECGCCWIFGAFGALESVINIREGIPDLDPDLSEQYVLSCLPRAGNCSGGDPIRAFRYIRDNTSNGNYCNGTIFEACFPYQADDAIPCTEKCEDWKKYLVPILAFGNTYASVEQIKSAIMEKGPVAGYILANRNFSRWSVSHHDPDDYFPYELSRDINHLIVIVGWKDDPSIGRGGYWICKNSWGSLFGYNGYFNIEYGSLGIEWSHVTWVDYDPASYDWHPTPKAYGPYYGLVNQPVQFKGNASGEHPPFTWLWDFGDGTTSTEQNPSHTYLSPGEYEVTLTVTDGNTQSFYDITSAWIQEANQPPDISPIKGPQIIKSGKECWYKFTVNDPDGGKIYIYWDYCDLCPGLWDDRFSSNEELSFSGIWDNSGRFTVRVKAKDPYGAESEWEELDVRVTRSKEISPLFLRFLERFPNLFPILQQILMYLG